MDYSHFKKGKSVSHIQQLRSYFLSYNVEIVDIYYILQTAWAQSTGIRESEFKDSWDLDEGSMYLPWDNLPKDLTHFLDGAIIDGASLPEHLKGNSLI
jgi:hypothetical protein